MHKLRWMCLCLAVVLAGCGVPREAGFLAQAEAMRSVPVETLSDEAVRAELRGEAARWAELRSLVRQRQPGGILLVPPAFEEEVARVAALSQRQQTLMDEARDDPALNRQALVALRRMWREAGAALSW